MAKSIYCIGSLHKNQKQYIIAEKGNNSDVPAKRVDLVTIKMIKESSVLYSGRKISTPADAVDLAKAFIDGSDREQFVVCTVDTKNQPTSISVVSIGSLNYTVVHPREVFKTAIMSNSSAIILFHNHPSGSPEPSNEDLETTRRLVEAGNIIGIKVIDHLIIGDQKWISLKEQGLI